MVKVKRKLRRNNFRGIELAVLKPWENKREKKEKGKNNETPGFSDAP